MNSTNAIERLREVLRRQHKALSTEECYVFWLRRFMAVLPTMPMGLSIEAKLERFLTELASRHNVAASTQNQAVNAILSFYRQVLAQPLGCVSALRAKRPVHERHAPTVTETHALLRLIRNEGRYPTNLIARLLYGCGLRGTEPLNLRIKDVDPERRRLTICGAKGGSDCVVGLPSSLVPEWFVISAKAQPRSTRRRPTRTFWCAAIKIQNSKIECRPPKKKRRKKLDLKQSTAKLLSTARIGRGKAGYPAHGRANCGALFDIQGQQRRGDGCPKASRPQPMPWARPA